MKKMYIIHLGENKKAKAERNSRHILKGKAEFRYIFQSMVEFKAFKYIYLKLKKNARINKSFNQELL